MNPPLKAKLFRGLGDPSRLAVLEALRRAPRCVSDLVEITKLSQPNLSMHLACLRDCGLVRAHRNGRFICYHLNHPEIARVLDTAGLLLRRTAKHIKACPRYGTATSGVGRRKRARPKRQAD